MSAVVVTGGTGRLGRAVVPVLRQAGHRVCIVTRRPPTHSVADRADPDAIATDDAHLPGDVDLTGDADLVAVADLVTGTGVEQALSGADVVVHLATTNGSRDVPMMANVLQAAARQGVDHLVYLSIVGSDRIPLPYYRHKAAAEDLALTSGLPVTVQRSTQFHPLVNRLFAVQRHLPAILVPAIRLQPIDTFDVAARVLELAATAPQGRVSDIGGPQVLQVSELARLWQSAIGRHRPVLNLRIPGRTFAGYVAGHHLVPEQPYGRLTFAQYLANLGN